MQSIAPLVAADFRAKVQRMLYRVELYVDSAWVDLTSLGGVNYLKSVSLDPSGAGQRPNPVSGTWSAEIYNANGIFHPFHPTSEYADYFRIGREVRISIGAVYDGTPYYFQRLIGYMDAPKFDHKSRTVSLSGCDYSKRLVDLTLRNPDNYWGDVAVFDSISSTGVTGAEVYAEADALDIAGEANNMNPWQDTSNATMESVADTGGGSVYVGRFQREAAPGDAHSHNANVGSITMGEMYYIAFKYKKVSGAGPAYLRAYQTLGSTLTQVGVTTLSSATWVTGSMTITALKTGALELRVVSNSGVEFDEIRIDVVSIKTYAPFWYRYELPSDCNGPHWVTLDGEPIFQGDRDSNGHFDGWLYDDETKYFCFDELKVVENGSDNLLVYYYMTHAVETIVADILVAAGYYADRAAALAAMDYAATGVTIDRPWFETGTVGFEAVKMLCERVNYRFWFGYGGTPTFQPAPVAGSVVFDFESFGDIAGLGDTQDLSNLKNRIVIEGIEQGMFETREDRQTTRFTGEASDATSIETYLEHTEPIRNHLFQDQASIDAMAATLLAAWKDPKWMAELTVPFNPVPLEVGDTVSWLMTLLVGTGDIEDTLYGGDFTEEPADTVYGGDFTSGPADTLLGGTFLSETVSVTMTGIIRSINLSGGTATYQCEIVEA